MITTITVNALPSAITGTGTVCAGLTTNLTDATGGGSWSSSNTTIASVVSGVVTGVAASTAIISYTSATGCSVTAIVTVNVSPTGIGGTLEACETATSLLNDATGGGAWSSSNTTIASIGTDGTVTAGSTAGSATISYTISGCAAIATFIVDAPPGAIDGVTGVCTGFTTTLADLVGGLSGTWSSSNTSVADVESSGLVIPVGAGTTTISYANGCGTPATVVVTVNQTPGAIIGASAVCNSSSTTFTDVNSGGIWSSNNTAIASVNFTSGSVTGVSQGTTTITYNLENGCTVATATISVDAVPATITGTPIVCVGSSTTLANTSWAGSWSSSSTTIATVGAGTGVVIGVAQGVVTITYNNGCGSAATTTVSVNASPSSISGNSPICTSVLYLTNSSTGGTWSSSNASIANVNPTTGVVTGVAGGTAIISYINGCGSTATTTVTVNLPLAINGVLTCDVSGNSTLTDVTTGGTWSSSSNTIATIGSSTGLVTGVSNGVVVISYTTACGVSTANFSVLPPSSCTPTCNHPTTICGSDYVVATTGYPFTIVGVLGTEINDATACNTTAYHDLTATTHVSLYQGGSYSATLGDDAGEVNMSCQLWIDFNSDGIFQTSESVGGGTWTALGGSTTQAVTIPSTVSPGSYRMRVINEYEGGTYTAYPSIPPCPSGSTMGYGEIRDYTVTILCNTPSVTGVSYACAGLTTTLSDAAGTGTWSSSNTYIATVASTTGIVTGIAGGAAVITYTSAQGCTATESVTINAGPASINGTSSVCVGSNTTLTDATSGGIWTSGSTTIATIGSSTGTVHGVAAGSANITYTSSTGCITTTSITVNALPGAIGGGPLTVCQLLTTTLTDATGGGTWSSSNTNANVVTGTGVVTGENAGTSVITYTSAAGCTATATVTVNVSPSGIGGTASACAGNTSTLNDATGGGLWTSSNTGIATVGSISGIVQAGGSAGSVTISYSISGCEAVTTFYVNSNPNPISGPNAVCTGNTITLSDGGLTGAWSSSNTSVAQIESTGLVIPVSAGTATITFSNGCGTNQTITLTVNQTPGAITGPTLVCNGSTINLTDANTGGTWTSGTTTVATIGASSGVVTGGASNGGTTLINYTLGDGCTNVTYIVTVYSTPTSINGTTSVCTSSSTSLSDAMVGGTWSSTNTSVATIGLTSGEVNGLVQGTATISYTNGCGSAATITVAVNNVPAGITGTTVICGSAVTLADASTGGTWISSTVSVATVVSGTGVVSGVAGGTTTITYTNGCGAPATTTVTVSPLNITGAPYCSVSGTSQLSDLSLGGTWTSSNTTIATINSSTGLVTGVASGNVTITYTTGCGASYYTFNVVATPACTPTAASWEAETPTTGANAFSIIGYSGSNLSSTGLEALVNGTTGYLSEIGTTPTNLQQGGTYSSSVTWNTASTYQGLEVWIDFNNDGTFQSSEQVVSGGPAGYSTTATPNPTTFSIVIPAGANSGVHLMRLRSIKEYATGEGVMTNMDPCLIKYGGANPEYQSGSVIDYPVNIVCNTPAITSSTFTVCGGSNITLSDATTGGTWTSSSTTIASINSSTGQITGGAGGGVAVITYALGTGCSVTQTVTVNPQPVTAASNNGPACPGGSIGLNANATGATTYSWSGPSSFSSTSATPTLSGSTLVGGTYSVVATTSLGCSATSGTLVIVNTLSVTPTNSSYACSGGSVNLYAGVAGTATGVTYSWSGPLGYTSASSSPVLNPVNTAMAGTYTVTASNGLSGCTATSTTTVTVDTLAVAPTNSSYACSGGSVNLYSGETGTVPSVTYSWSGPLGYTSASSSPVLNPVNTAMAGTYTITATSAGSG